MRKSAGQTVVLTLVVPRRLGATYVEYRQIRVEVPVR